MVLNMGEPVKIVDLARNMIVLNGLTPDEDIQIKYTGPIIGLNLCMKYYVKYLHLRENSCILCIEAL